MRATERTNPLQSRAHAIAIDPEFSGDDLYARDGEVWCHLCNACAGKDMKYVRQHVTGHQSKDKADAWRAKPVEERKKLRHYKRRLERDQSASDMRAYLQKQEKRAAREVMLLRPNIDGEVMAHRVSVLRTLLAAGIPLSKLDNPPIQQALGKARFTAWGS